MLTELTRKNGSSRVVCFQFEEPLRKLGIEARFFPPSSVRSYEVFCEAVVSPRWLVILRKAIYWYGLVLPLRLAQIIRAGFCHVVLIQRGLFRYNSPPVLEWLLWLWTSKLLGRPVLYTLDDAQYRVANPRYFQWRFRMADCVYTGNEEIAAYARQWNPRVTRIEAGVDTRVAQPKQHKEHWPVVIGWVGTLLDQDGYLGLMGEIVRELRLKYPIIFRVVSNWPSEPCGVDGWEKRRWTLKDEWQVLVGFDIGVMPLPDDEFTRAKEGYKLKQYMAAGLPVVCSPVGQNLKLVQDGVNGYFARVKQEWVERLARLVSDWKLREEMGRAGRSRVEERFSLEVVTPQLAAFMRGAAGGVHETVGQAKRPTGSSREPMRSHTRLP